MSDKRSRRSTRTRLRQILTDLIRSKSDGDKRKSEEELRKYIESYRNEVGVHGTTFLDDLNVQLQGLVDVGVPSDKLASIINFLIDNTPNEPRKIAIFSNYLRNALSNYKPSDTATLSEITSALGRLAKASTLTKTLTAEWVDFECKRALEWLESKDRRIYASILVLSELAENSPTFFFPHVGEFLRLIWIGLRDSSDVIREASVRALRPVLILVAERQCTNRIFWYHHLRDQVKAGFQRSRDLSMVHGSLLVTGELLRNTGPNLMRGDFEIVCGRVLGFANNKDKSIRRAVISLIPILAKFYGEPFNRRFLPLAFDVIFRVFRGNVNRETAYVALGELCLVVGRPLAMPHKELIIQVIADGLTARRGRPFVQESLQCLALLGQTLKNAIRDDVVFLLQRDLPFLNGISRKLFFCLDSLSKSIPSLLSMIQKKLLDTISIILSKSPYSPIPMLDRFQVSPALDDTDPKNISLALSTLGSFNMSGHDLTDFVADCIVKYLDHDNPTIRNEAARTCCALLLLKEQGDARVRTYVTSEDEMSYQGYVVGEVVQKLLTVSISDADPTIRLTVLENLDSRFDRYLALSDNLSLLFISLHDEHFRIREVSIMIIGRLSDKNPAYVLSSLRRILLQLLTKLEFSADSRSKGESAQMLGHLIMASPRLIRPYVPNIYNVLKKNILDPNVNVSSMVLDAIGKLSMVGGKDMVEFFNELLPLLIQTLQDQSSSQKREIAVRTLGLLVKSTGCVVAPYTAHPRLLTILLNILRSEEEWSARREVIKVLGIIGAIDPYAHKLLVMGSSGDEIVTGETMKQTEDDILADLTPSSEEYSPTVAFIALMKILKDPTLQTHHGDVIQAVVYIFRSLGMRCVPYLEQVISPFFELIRSCKSIAMKVNLFQQLCVLVNIVKHHIRGYLDEIFVLMNENWNSLANIQIMSLQEELCLALNEEFTKYLPEVMPPIILAINSDKSVDHSLAKKGLDSIRVFSKYLGHYLYLVIPCVVDLFEKPDASRGLIQSAIRTIDSLCVYLDIFEYSSRIIHPLVRLLRKNDTEITKLVLRTLMTLIVQLKARYLIFVPLVDDYLVEMRSILDLKPTLQEYEALVTRIRKSKSYYEFDTSRPEPPAEETGIITDVPKIQVNVLNLKRAWEATHRSAKDDWVEWCRGLSVELLKESPSPALRSCSALATFYHPLSKELFNAAFISCWCELDQKSKDEIVRAIEMAFSSPQLPSEVLQTLLNVAEFMEHDEKPLPIAITSLGYIADKCKCFAKALHYKELEFQLNPAQHINGLISINNKLHQHEAAIGILFYAQKHEEIEFRDDWYEELQRWEDALVCYQRRQLEDPASLDATLGVMRCLASLGEWEKLGDLTMDVWSKSDAQVKEQVAVMTAHSAWLLSNWDFVEESCRHLQNDSRGNFFRAVLAVHREDFDRAQGLIDQARVLLDRDLSALVGESYTRAYDSIVVLQQLVELEEVIDFCKNPRERLSIKKIWADRLAGLSNSVKQWRRILSIRQLVLSPEELTPDYIKLAELARREGTFSMSSRIFRSILVRDFDPEENPGLLLTTDVQPEIAYNFFIHMWDCRKRKASLELMSEFVRDETLPPELLARSYVKLGLWNKEISFQPGYLDDSKIQLILRQLQKATYYDAEWSHGWHEWAVFHAQVANYLEHQLAQESVQSSPEPIPIPRRPPPSVPDDEGGDEEEGETPTRPPAPGAPSEVSTAMMIEHHVSASIGGFFRSVSLASLDSENRLQDILRLLTLWFNHGTLESVNRELSRGFEIVSVDTWLDVIPQIIARINCSNVDVKTLVTKLLVSIGKEHPQALVYPLTVSSKSENKSRNVEALRLLNTLRQHHPLLVDQSLLVSNEVIRVAILWAEKWQVGLEEASRLYFGHRNVKEMFNVLMPLHKQIENPETLSEVAFQQTFGRDLKEAYKWCRRYEKQGREADLAQAWDLYYSVFRRIAKQLQHMVKLELRYISPKLLRARNMELAVPGTYLGNRQRVVDPIGRFVERLELISSKQRPRKIRIDDVEGSQFLFLLKGHEDLRQDERVMQLFGLVNELLKNNPSTRNKFLNIKRYSVIPLSSNAGLLGWVSNCDTLHALIKEYREARGVLLNIEHRFMIQMAPYFDHLSLMQKIEVFEYALANTSGLDLYKMLWLKSKNSEVWLEKRTQFTRSLAVMSMVGYVLGLGDRHPSNLMLEKHTGKIVHIDFGDCFEVAMHRDKYPELIPFRLTRMLVNAMEVCGVEGTFRATCESVMKVMRSNKNSVMAMLEAFVYDPLINWRLIETKFRKKQHERHQRNLSLAHLMAPGADFGQDPEDIRPPSRDSPMPPRGREEGFQGFERPGQRDQYEPRSVREKDLRRSLLRAGVGSPNISSTVNKKALSVIKRIENKLDGRDFDETMILPVADQVSLLIEQAQLSSNLSRLYIGWCAFW